MFQWNFLGVPAMTRTIFKNHKLYLIYHLLTCFNPCVNNAPKLMRSRKLSQVKFQCQNVHILHLPIRKILLMSTCRESFGRWIELLSVVSSILCILRHPWTLICMSHTQINRENVPARKKWTFFKRYSQRVARHCCCLCCWSKTIEWPVHQKSTASRARALLSRPSACWVSGREHHIGSWMWESSLLIWALSFIK